MSLALMLPGNRREVVKTTPVMTLGAVLAEACGRAPRPLGDPSQFLLMNGKAVLDLSTPVRFAGLANGARLDVVRNPAAAAAPSAAAPQPQPAAAEATHAQQPASASALQVEAAQPPPASDAAPSAACDDMVVEGTSAARCDGGAAGAATGGDADPVLAAAAAAAAAASSAAAAEASAAVAARVGRVVRVYSREALLRAADAPPVEELPESFYECVGGCEARLRLPQR